MSQVLRNESTTVKYTKKSEKEYQAFLDDPITFSIDEVLQVLGPRHQKI